MCKTQAVNIFMLNNESLANATAAHAYVNDEANEKLQREELKKEIDLDFKEHDPIENLRQAVTDLYTGGTRGKVLHPQIIGMHKQFKLRPLITLKERDEYGSRAFI